MFSIYYLCCAVFPRFNPGVSLGPVNDWCNVGDSKYWLVPVNKGNSHWLCLFLDMKTKRYYVLDPLDTSMESNTFVWTTFGTLVRYLGERGVTSCQGPWDRKVFNQIPRQRNGYDCGVFLCMFLYSIYRGKGIPCIRPELCVRWYRQVIAHSIVHGCMTLSTTTIMDGIEPTVMNICRCRKERK